MEHGSSIPDGAQAGRGRQAYSWGSQLEPWEIGWNGQRWLEEHLSMTDVREGFRCARPRCSAFSAAS